MSKEKYLLIKYKQFPLVYKCIKVLYLVFLQIRRQYKLDRCKPLACIIDLSLTFHAMIDNLIFNWENRHSCTLIRLELYAFAMLGKYTPRSYFDNFILND